MKKKKNSVVIFHVLSRVASVRKSLWIGTTDIKKHYVKVGDGTMPFLAVLAQLVRKDMEVCQSMQPFDEMWMELHCGKRLRLKFCGDSIV